MCWLTTEDTCESTGTWVRIRSKQHTQHVLVKSWMSYKICRLCSVCGAVFRVAGIPTPMVPFGSYLHSASSLSSSVFGSRPSCLSLFIITSCEVMITPNSTLWYSFSSLQHLAQCFSDRNAQSMFVKQFFK